MRLSRCPRAFLLLILFALSGEGLVQSVQAQTHDRASHRVPGSIPGDISGGVLAPGLDTAAMGALLGYPIQAPPPCDSLQEPGLAQKADAWFTRIRALQQDPSFHYIQRDNPRYRLVWQSTYTWRDHICFADQRTHCRAIARDPSLIQYGRDLVSTAGSEGALPGFAGQTRWCTSYDEGRFLLCTDLDVYIGNSCWGTEIVQGFERMQTGLTPFR